MYIGTLSNVPYMRRSGPNINVNNPVRSEALIRSFFKFASIPIFTLQGQLIRGIPEPARGIVDEQSKRFYRYIVDNAVIAHRQSANVRMGNGSFDTYGPQRWFNNAINYIVNQTDFIPNF